VTVENILEWAGIPLLISIVCIYYGIRLLVFQDICAIRGKDKEAVKDERMYARKAGCLVLFYGAASFVMAGLLLWNVYVAVVEISICTILLGVLWRRMSKLYGVEK
jgi:hypothetical protein